MSLLVVLSSTLARGAGAATPGIDLGWDGCGFGGSSQQRCYACDGHAGGPFVFTASYRSPQAIPDLVATISTVDLDFTDAAGATVAAPDFWMLDLPSGCALGHLQVRVPDPATGCRLAIGADTTGMSWSLDVSHPTANRERIGIEMAFSQGPAGVAADTLYGAMAFAFDADGIVTAGCAGCATHAHIVLQSVELLGASPGEDVLITSLDQQRAIDWQGTVAAPCATVGAARSSWGAIKALYR